MQFNRCNKKREKRRRATLSITIDPKILDGLKEWMKREGETNISAAIEGFIDCGIRDTCEDCPYYDKEEEEQAESKMGVAKRIVK